MDKAILLKTDWRKDYWHKSKKAFFPGENTTYKHMSDWFELSHSCPLPGIGMYYKKHKTVPFVYIKIKGMYFHTDTENPSFDFEVIKPSLTESETLRSIVARNYPGLYCSIPISELLDILNEIGEDIPESWRKLANLPSLPDIQTLRVDWKDYIGRYFLELTEKNLSNDEFEDRVACLFTALGFNVTQKGHTKPGAYTDGVAIYEDIGLVYDCKNSHSFIPIEDNMRALKEYTEDETDLNPKIEMYGLFISNSSHTFSKPKMFHTQITSLLYLLYLKLKKGSEFNLNPLKLILRKKRELDQKTIDEFWND